MKNFITSVTYIAVLLLYVIMCIAIPMLIVAGGIALYNSWQEPETTKSTSGYPASDYNDDTEINVQQEDVEPVNDRLTQFQRDNFNEGCYNGTNESYCNCVVDWYQENYTNDQFNQIALEYLETNVIPDSMYKAVDFCTRGE